MPAASCVGPREQHCREKEQKERANQFRTGPDREKKEASFSLLSRETKRSNVLVEIGYKIDIPFVVFRGPIGDFPPFPFQSKKRTFALTQRRGSVCACLSRVHSNNDSFLRATTAATSCAKTRLVTTNDNTIATTLFLRGYQPAIARPILVLSALRVSTTCTRHSARGEIMNCRDATDNQPRGRSRSDRVPRYFNEYRIGF